MKKYEYEIAGLDCAACANKIQEELSKNPELKNVSVNFAKQRISYETEKAFRFSAGKAFSSHSLFFFFQFLELRQEGVDVLELAVD